MLEQVFRDEHGRVLASLVGFLGDIELAEDAAQDAQLADEGPEVVPIQERTEDPRRRAHPPDRDPHVVQPFDVLPLPGAPLVRLHPPEVNREDLLGDLGHGVLAAHDRVRVDHRAEVGPASAPFTPGSPFAFVHRSAKGGVSSRPD